MNTTEAIAESFRRPYPVSVPMVLLAALVPFYIFIGESMPGRVLHAPALPLDRMFPVQPAWALVYGVLYLFLIVLPVFVVRQQEQIRRTVLAYLMVWLSAYVVFLTWPTVAPRPPIVTGNGFIAWGLRFLYDADPPYNCFPSLHVAHSFVSALTCYRVHRRVGIASIVCASLVGLSTLFTKQHYVVDVLAGIALAYAAYFVFLRGYRDEIPELDRRLAPVLAMGLMTVLGGVLVCCWAVWRISASPSTPAPATRHSRVDRAHTRSSPANAARAPRA